MKNQSVDNGADNPVVQIGDANSVFPHWFSQKLSKQGVQNTIVSCNVPSERPSPSEAEIIDATKFESRLFKLLKRRILAPFVSHLQAQTPKYRKSFLLKTGMPESHWQPYLDQFVGPLLNAWALSRAARAQNARLYIAHEVSTHGLALAFCPKRAPKILLPWGGDVFLSCETSKVYNYIITYALQKADLVVPASINAAKHIVQRFKIDPAKVIGHTAGVDLSMFSSASITEKRELRIKHNIPADKIVIISPRRFRPPWGCNEIFEAFLSLASRRSDLHFIVLGGAGTQAYMQEAEAKALKSRLNHCFTFLNGHTYFETFAELARLSDVFISMSPLSDMRSATVLQLVACGVVPLLLDNPEWRHCSENGLRAFYYKDRSPACVLRGLHEVLENTTLWPDFRSANANYVAEHEDAEKQWRILCDMIHTRFNVCLRQTAKCGSSQHT